MMLLITVYYIKSYTDSVVTMIDLRNTNKETFKIGNFPLCKKLMKTNSRKSVQETANKQVEKKIFKKEENPSW